MSAPPLPTKRYKTKLEPSMVKIAGTLSGQGLTLKNIAGALEVTEKTLKAWRDEGNEDDCPDPVKVQLAMALAAGRALVTTEMVDCLKAHARSDWKAAQALLISMETESYNPTKKVEQKIEMDVVAGPKDLSALSYEQLVQMKEINKTLEEAKKLK